MLLICKAVVKVRAPVSEAAVNEPSAAWPQVEQEKLSQWVASKRRAWHRAREVYRAAGSALRKRKGKAESIRSATLQALNVRFATCARRHSHYCVERCRPLSNHC